MLPANSGGEFSKTDHQAKIGERLEGLVRQPFKYFLVFFTNYCQLSNENILETCIVSFLCTVVSSIYNLDFGFLDCLYVFTCTPRRCKDKGIPIHPPIHPEYFYVSFFSNSGYMMVVCEMKSYLILVH